MLPPHIAGTLFMVLSALCFAFMTLFVKLSAQAGLPFLQIVAARSLLALLFSAADVYRKGIHPLGNRRGLLLIRGLCGAAALCSIYYALGYIPLAEAAIIQHLHPVIIAILGVLFLREALRWQTLVCIIFGMAGLILVVYPELLVGRAGAPLLSNSTATPLAYAAAVFGAVLSAFAYTIVRKLSTSEDVSVIILYFPLVALPCALLLPGEDFLMPTGLTWIHLFFVGVGAQGGQIFLTRALKAETAAKATAVSYTQIIFAALLGYFVLGESLGWNVFLGGALVIAGVLLNLSIGTKK